MSSQSQHRSPNDPLLLKQVRHSRDIGGHKVAEAMDVHWSSVYRHERTEGHRVPREVLMEYARIYNCDVSAFFLEQGVL